MTQVDYIKFAKETLGVEFKDIQTLVTALTHRSWVNEARKSRGIEHNERLEFLGDAVLELVTTEFLYEHYDEAEGIMTNWRSALVRTESIGAAAQKLGFFKVMHMSRGEKTASDRAKLQMLANAYEAVVGAIYLDQGYDAAKDFIAKTVLVTLDDILKNGTWQDAKSRLQELSQAKDSATPTYKVIKDEGPDHDKIFTVGVYVKNNELGQGKGPSKQTAQQAAAEEALKTYDS